MKPRPAADAPIPSAGTGDRSGYHLGTGEVGPPVAESPDALLMTEVRRRRQQGLTLTAAQRAAEAAYQEQYLKDRLTVRPTPQEIAAWPAMARQAGHRGVAPWLLMHARRSINGEVADVVRDRVRDEEVNRLRRECERLEQENAAMRQEILEEGEWARRIVENIAVVERAAALGATT